MMMKQSIGGGRKRARASDEYDIFGRSNRRMDTAQEADPMFPDSTIGRVINWGTLSHHEFMDPYLYSIMFPSKYPSWIESVCKKDEHGSQTRLIEPTGARSLKYYVTQTVLDHFQEAPQDITPRILGQHNSGDNIPNDGGYELQSQIPWSILWKAVWNIMTTSGGDTFQNFQMFASAFSNELSFFCHDKHTYHSGKGPDGLNGLRRTYLRSKLMAVKFNHRFEHLVYNTHIKSLVQSLNQQKFNHIALLDLSYSNLDRRDYIELTALQNLVGLDVTGCKQVDQNVLFAWILAMKRNQQNRRGNRDEMERLWPNLRMLCLGATKSLGSKTVAKLFTECSNLTYIEVDEKYLEELDSSAKELMGIEESKTKPVWVPRKKLNDRLLSVISAQRPNPDQRVQQSLDALENFGKVSKSYRNDGLSIGRIYFLLRSLYRNVKIAASSLSTLSVKDIMINPEVGITITANNNRYIVQEMELAAGIPSPEQAEVYSKLFCFGISGVYYLIFLFFCFFVILDTFGNSLLNDPTQSLWKRNVYAQVSSTRRICEFFRVAEAENTSTCLVPDRTTQPYKRVKKDPATISNWIKTTQEYQSIPDSCSPVKAEDEKRNRLYHASQDQTIDKINFEESATGIVLADDGPSMVPNNKDHASKTLNTSSSSIIKPLTNVDASLSGRQVHATSSFKASGMVCDQEPGNLGAIIYQANSSGNTKPSTITISSFSKGNDRPSGSKKQQQLSADQLIAKKLQKLKDEQHKKISGASNKNVNQKKARIDVQSFLGLDRK